MAVWIPVAERLPDADLTVLIATDPAHHSEPVWLGFHDGEAWREVNGEPAFVTHWQEMLEPPTTGEPAPREVDALAAIAAGLAQYKYRQGTKECVAFYRGACWQIKQ